MKKASFVRSVLAAVAFMAAFASSNTACAQAYPLPINAVISYLPANELLVALDGAQAPLVEQLAFLPQATPAYDATEAKATLYRQIMSDISSGISAQESLSTNWVGYQKVLTKSGASSAQIKQEGVELRNLLTGHI